VERRKERLITKKRGGTVRFDGGLNEGHDFLLKRIENISPQAVYSNSRVINKNSSNWLYNNPMGILHSKPGHEFNKELLKSSSQERWRNGSLMTLENRNEVWKQTLNTLPIFRKKPSDPFRSNPQMNDRISFKDPKTLSNFLTRGGRIVSSRFSGVKWKTQKKIKKEIHKARFLGIFSYSGNAQYNQPEFQPQFNSLFSEEEAQTEMNKLLSEKNWLKDYLKNLENGIQVTGSNKWIPPLSRTNPRHSERVLKLEKFGRTKNQLEKKYEEISHMDQLDNTLSPFRKVYNTTKSKLM